MLKFISITTILLTLTACATTAVPQTPSSRLLAFQEPTDKTRSSIIVNRDNGFLGGGCFYGVEINGKLAARLDVGEQARFYVEPGQIKIRAARDPLGIGLCALGGHVWVTREFEIKPNEVRFFRISLSLGEVNLSSADP